MNKVVELPHLPWFQVEEAFPFIFAWNEALKKFQVGHSLTRIAPDVAEGVQLDLVFKQSRARRPSAKTNIDIKTNMLKVAALVVRAAFLSSSQDSHA